MKAVKLTLLTLLFTIVVVLAGCQEYKSDVTSADYELRQTPAGVLVAAEK